MKLLLLTWCLLFGHQPVNYSKGFENPDSETIPFRFIYQDIDRNKEHTDYTFDGHVRRHVPHINGENTFDVHFCRRCGLVYWVKRKS